VCRSYHSVLGATRSTFKFICSAPLSSLADARCVQAPIRLWGDLPCFSRRRGIYSGVMKRHEPVHASKALWDEVRFPAGNVELAGSLEIPAHARGVVLFVHGSGSSRHSPRNRFVAQALQEAGVGTLLFDLLTRREEQEDALTGHLRFDIEFLARRLQAASQWAAHDARTTALHTGYFGSSTGAAAALVAAAIEGADVGAIVSRGGRPDLAGDALGRVRAPTLLIVGGEDHDVIPLNADAFADLNCTKRMEIVPGASHLFEEPGTLEAVAELAAQWFAEHLPPQGWHP
jgi:putative phosphoribosyl transferase